MYQTLIQMPSVQWCLIFKGNSTVLLIHVGRWRVTGPPGTHSGYHGRCWGVEPVRLFQSPGFYPLHFQMSYSNDNNYKNHKWLFFPFFDMAAFSRFPPPHSFPVKNTYFIYFLIRTTARCSRLPFSTHDCWTAVAPSLVYTWQFQHKSFLMAFEKQPCLPQHWHTRAISLPQWALYAYTKTTPQSLLSVCFLESFYPWS